VIQYRLVIESSHEYYWKFEASLCQLTSHLHTGHVTELNIDDKAIGFAHRGGAEECFGGIEGVRGISKCAQNAYHRLAHFSIVIDNTNNLFLNWRQFQ